MFFVYILYSKKFNRYYVGSTENVEQRLKFHNSDKARSTKKYQPWELVKIESFQSRSEAYIRELEIKKSKNIKRYL